MRLTLLVLFLFKSVIADDESDEKYIDNLPEDEKREFLEKIARRILQDYQNNNEPKSSSVNISDEALNTHTAYVQSILKEERTKTNKTIERKDKKIDSTKKKEEYLRKSSENEKFIDLTMRASKKDKRRNVQNESHTNDVYIPVLPLYDTNINLNDNSESYVQNNKNTVAKTTPKGKLHYDNNSKNYSKYIRHSFVYDDSEEISQHKSTVIDNFEPGSSDKNQYSSEEIREDATKDNYEKNSTIHLTTHATEDNVISSKDNNGTDNISKNQSNIETIELLSEENLSIINTTLNFEMTQTTANNFTTITGDLETTTIPHSITFKEDSILEIIKDNPKLVRSKTVLDDHVPDKRIINLKNKIKNDTSRNSSITIEDGFNKTTTGLPTESSSSQTENCVTVGTTNKSIEVDPMKNTKQTNKSTHEIFHGGRKTYPEQQIQKAEKKIIKDLRTNESSDTGTKENKSVYFVYEVSAERPPFVTRKSNEDNFNEHPHYAPVYNYSPENAYYDPNNRYGANENDIYIDENQDSLSNLRTFVKDIQKGSFKSTHSEFLPVKFNFNNILKHKNPYNIQKPTSDITNSHNYNPYDYIDMDYFFVRNENPMRKGKLSENNLPNTEESDHPYSNYKEGHVKDHVQAVRKLLFSNQMFGYIPSVNEKRQTNILRNNNFLHDIFHNDDDKDKDDIAIDYYFGRQNSEELYNKFNYEFHKFQQLKPITSIPIERKQKQMKTKLLQLKEIDVIEASCNVLKDFIKMDNDVFANYDWLRTAVDVQSALEKLYDLTEGLKSGEHLHPYDLELLKYVIYLYKSSQASSNSLSLATLQSTLNELRKNIKKKSLVPKIKKQKKGFKSAVKMWKDFATFLRSLMNGKKKILFEFQNFLSEVQFNLNDLHEAIKYVAMVTTYKSQNWHADLKNLYFQHADRRKLLTILLHLSVSRLFGLIEDTQIVLEESFSSFVKNNKEDVDTARDEFIFVLKLLDELKKIY